MSQLTLAFIAKLLAYAGGTVALAYGIFLWLGKRWLESWFARRLEAYKHAQNKELEQYKYEINSLFNKITKIHEKEFEVLPEAWKKLIDAFGHVTSLISPLQSYPDLNLMKKEEIEEFLKDSELRDYQKKELMESKDKVAYYKEKIFWHRFNKAQTFVYELHNYLMYNKIFLSSDIFEKFKEMDDLLYKALTATEWGQRDQERKLIIEAYKNVKENADPIMDEIERMVQSRLHYQEAD